MTEHILATFGLKSGEYRIRSFGTGLINRTWEIHCDQGHYILQEINSDIFTAPEDIDHNIAAIGSHLSTTQPDYLFVQPLTNFEGQSLVLRDGRYFRLFPFVENSITFTALSDKTLAYEAARQFGKFTRLLEGFDAGGLKTTIPDFHNLSLRYQQFNIALNKASTERLDMARESILNLQEHVDIVHTYEKLLTTDKLPVRVIHHDTKISNVLFSAAGKGLCVIDLDTVMPGYFISDVGDMMRTYLAAATEEETDITKIEVRRDFYDAIKQGYLEEMSDLLTEVEKNHFHYAGSFLIYMQAIRFLTDYLSDDIYYGQTYEGQNLNRAKNQIALLKAYLSGVPDF